jgi:small-conductance mechanosensitive channel/CRP-like cAMP-binding protein
MNNSPVSDIPIFLVFLLVFIALFAAILIYFILRRVYKKTVMKPERKSASVFLSKLSLPLAFLLVTLAFKIKPLAGAVSFGPKFLQAIDAALIFFTVFLVIRLIDASLQSWYSKRRLQFPLPRVLHGLVEIVIYLAILFWVLKGILGINITPFLATSAILTAIIGLALQGVLSNLLSGMSLHLTKSFSSGDWIKIGPHEGIVLDTNWRETRLFDRFSNVIVIPNYTGASEMITNFSQPDAKSAVTIPLKVSYQAPPSTVIELLKEAARDIPEVLTSPPPHALILGYDDLGVSYILKFWITDFAKKNITSGQVARLIWYKFQRQNIEIPVSVGDRFQELYHAVLPKEKIRSVDEEKESIYTNLHGSSFLRYQEGERVGELLVSDEDVRELAALIKKRRYAPGEVLFRQGDHGETCYVVARGSLRGEIVYEENGKKFSSEFKVGPGGIFGEMSLFTGMPRTATGIILEESELLEIKADAFGTLLARDPNLAELVAEIVTARNQKNQEFLSKIKELSEKDLKNSTSKKPILDRLRSFVHLFKKQ